MHLGVVRDAVLVDVARCLNFKLDEMNIMTPSSHYYYSNYLHR